LINSILRVTGKITRFDNVVNFPVTNDKPHKNSTLLPVGINKLAIKPTWKALNSPVDAGST
jgi:hypothetical protein